MLAFTTAHAAAPSIDEALRTGATSPTDVAVIIGNEDYGFIADVPYAKRDSQAFYDFLAYTRGVPADRIRLLNDKSKEAIQQAMTDAEGLARADGTFWIYFAGHGAADPSTGARLLLGRDVDVDPAVFVARGLDVGELQAEAASTGATVVMLIDACFNGAGRDGSQIVAGKRFAVPAYAVQATGRVSEWAATSPEQLASGLPAVQHGAFTYFAIAAMRGWADGEVDGQRNGDVTLAEAQAWVSRTMRAAQITDQTPVVSGGSRVSLVMAQGLEVAPGTEAVVALVHPSTNGPEPTPIGDNDGFAALAARAQAQRAALAALEAERRKTLDTGAAELRARATADYQSIASVVGDPQTSDLDLLDAYVAKYEHASVTAGDVTELVAIPEVHLVEAAIASLRGLTPGSILEHNVLGISFRSVAIPAATLIMGSPSSYEHKIPVTIGTDYHIMQSEVTQELWTAVMGSNPSYWLTCGPKCPVEKVSREDALAFARKLSELDGREWRLPTDAEWENAARGGSDSYNLLWGHEFSWWGNESGGTPHPVCTKQMNGYNLCDMVGNVSERTGDVARWTLGYAYDICRGGGYGVLKHGASTCEPTRRSMDLGFRLVHDAQNSPQQPRR